MHQTNQTVTTACHQYTAFMACLLVC